MATGPCSIEIRSYQVGFGDCFLLSFIYPDEDKRHVLIDFGTSGLPGTGSKKQPSKHMPRVAEDISKVCGNKLTAVVATHRHLDHISGFATDGTSGGSGIVIKNCLPKVVLQPWTEDPSAATDAVKATAGSNRTRKSLVNSLEAMHRFALAIYDFVQSPPPTMGVSLVKQLKFIGGINLKNKSAVKNLMNMGGRKGAKAIWACHGSQSGLEPHLPGVKVHVLGPPDLTQSETIRKMCTSDPDEFWQLLATPTALHIAGGAARLRLLKKSTSRTKVPPEARWFRDRLAKLNGEQVLEIVRVLDEQMNNTSLVLLFEVGDKKLLFPGDAQIENWGYALQDAPNAATNRKLIAASDLYKVGHHGSRNATPRQLLWEAFTRRGRNGKGRLITLLSTMPGKHGKLESQTEVPRQTLVEALNAETELHRTDYLRSSAGSPLCDKVIIDT